VRQFSENHRTSNGLRQRRLYPRYAQIDPVVSNRRQHNSAGQSGSTTLPRLHDPVGADHENPRQISVSGFAWREYNTRRAALARKSCNARVQCRKEVFGRFEANLPSSVLRIDSRLLAMAM
jgi:hypothetical protein